MMLSDRRNPTGTSGPRRRINTTVCCTNTSAEPIVLGHPPKIAVWNIIELPCEVLGRVESYLGASDCAHWSSSCLSLKARWNGRRWQQTFRLHYGAKSGSSSSIPSAPSMVVFAEDLSAEQTLSAASESTQFNMSSLLPSIYKVYAYLWDTIELAMLGYYGTVDSYSASGMIAAGMDYILFLITLNPLLSWKSLWKTHPTTDCNHKMFLRIPYSISPWKLVCILKERGVPCMQCRLCNKIDVLGGRATTWIRPCLCPDLVHRDCLERRIGLAVNTLYCRTRDRRWITYDETLLPNPPIFSVSGIAAVNDQNEFTHNPQAFCRTCQTTYCRSVRLPYNAKEVILVSLVDRLSLLRAFSTFIHFLLACFVISAIEALSDPNDQSIVILNASPYLLLKWPRNNAWALAWWQLQRCCLLHIFFSPRFAAVVDRLWTHGPIKYFYCRLYLYFIVTSFGLSLGFLPFFQRFVRKYLATEALISTSTVLYWKDLWNLLSLANFAQFCIVSTMVVCIFWRTNLRIFTIADKRQKSNTASSLLGTTGWHSHPIYHGAWQ